MSCKYCGGYTEDRRTVCYNCARKHLTQKKKTKSFGSVLRGFMHLIILLATLVALVFGILNLFSVFNVWVNGEENGSPVVGPARLKDLLEILKKMGVGFTPGYIGNIILGLFLLISAFVGALYCLKRMMGLPLYGRFVGRYLGRLGGPALIMGVLGTLGTLLQVIMYGFCHWEYKKQYLTFKHELELKVSVNWTTWLLLGLSVLMIVLDFAARKKKKR